MKKNKRKLYINLSILIIFLFSIYLITTPLRPEVEAPLLNQGGVGGGNSATISTGNIKIQLSFLSNTLLYDALIQEKNAGKIELSGKNYPGLGFFVTDIGTLHAGNGKNLVYYINGKEASVGVSSYILKDDDIIEWKLE